MRKKIAHALSITLMVLILTSCGLSDNGSNSNISMIDNPPVEDVKTVISQISTITEIGIVTEDNDPNNQLGKQGGYTGCIFFTDINAPETDGVDAIEKGTNGGGSIEIYANATDAKKRDDYLASLDGTIFSSGSHTVIGTLVVRTSNNMKASQQKALESQLIDVLNGKKVNIPDKPNEIVSLSTESKEIDFVRKTYANITFEIDSSWNEEILDDGRCIYYPGASYPMGFIQNKWDKAELEKFSDYEAHELLNKSVQNTQDLFENVEEIKRAFYKIDGHSTIRVSFYFDYDFDTEENDIIDDKRGVIDLVIVLFNDGAARLTALFSETGYMDTYSEFIEKALSTVEIDYN